MHFLMLTSESLLTQPSEGEYQMLSLHAMLSRFMSSRAHFQPRQPPASFPNHSCELTRKKKKQFEPSRYGLPVNTHPIVSFTILSVSVHVPTISKHRHDPNQLTSNCLTALLHWYYFVSSVCVCVVVVGGLEWLPSLWLWVHHFREKIQIK